MDRLNIMEGVGHPLRQNDFKFLQDAYTDALKGLCSAFNITNKQIFIISGCEITQVVGNFNIAAGYVSYNNEIVKVDAHSVTISGGYVCTIVETNDGNSITYQDGTFHNVYKKRRAVFQAGVSGGFATPYLFPRMSDGYHRVGDAADAYYDAANTILTFQNSFAEYTGGVFRKLTLRIEQGLLILAGRVKADDIDPFTSGWVVITKLPHVMRPNVSALFKVMVEGTNFYELIPARLSSNGDLSVFITGSVSAQATKDISFDGERIALL